MTNIITLLDYTEYCLVKFGKILSSVEKLTLSMGWYVFRRGPFAIKNKKKRGEKHHAVVLSACHTDAQYAVVPCLKILAVYEAYFLELYDIH